MATIKAKPKRSLAETDAILCAPGNPHELQTILVDGQLQRVYKNLWPSLREFWLWASQEHSQATYIVFEQQRFTFNQISQRAARAAAVYRVVYNIEKGGESLAVVDHTHLTEIGDRVGICSRNYPEYLVAFWACHLIGAVSVLINAWLPPDGLRHCLSLTRSKLIIVDSERADKMEAIIQSIAQDSGATGVLVLESHEGKGKWAGMECWKLVMESFEGQVDDIFRQDIKVLPEDNATIFFTSGTTGLPKGVLSTQRMFLTNILNTLVGSRRALLRQGENLPELVAPPGPQKGILISVPLFHVTGLTSHSMMASLAGMKIVLMRKWIPKEAIRLIKNENITIAGGVPSMALDILETPMAGNFLESLTFGGAPAPDSIATKARQTLPTATLSQGYGLTETNSVAASITGDDYLLRPLSCGLSTPVNDIVIMNGSVSAPPGVVGEVWIRGPNIMKGYWNNPDATKQVITQDGWLRTGDLGFLDEEGFLYIRDRIKDVIIRGGENIDSVAVENVLYSVEGVSEVAVVGVPHERLGEIVAALVSVRPGFLDQVTESSLLSVGRKKLPKFAIPAMIIVQENPFEHTPSGKIIKNDLRRIAREVWNKRIRDANGGASGDARVQEVTNSKTLSKL